jgi:putative hydrolases of HD superfamily
VSGRLADQLAFLRELDAVKLILRQSHVQGTDRREDDAQHQWHVAVMALVLAEHADDPVDVARVVAMLLLHDVVEIDAGDVFAYDEAAAVGKADRERACAERVFGLLPPDQDAWARGLWEEFEAGESPEARFAAAIDRLQPLLQNLATDGLGWRRNGVAADRVYALNSRIANGSTALWDHARSLLDEAVAGGILPTAD